MKKIYYKEDNYTTECKLEELLNCYSVSYKIENIEMNWLKIIIRCKKEDEEAIDRIMNE